MAALLILFFLGFSYLSVAQTCCTGGVPHLAGFRVPQTSKGMFGASFSYIYNSNRDLIVNNSEVSGSNIFRNVNSMLLQGDYSISDRFSTSVILPFIIQKEEILSNKEIYTYTNSGVGDVSFWGNYKSDLNSKLFASFSAGIKLPTGNTDKRDEVTGIPLPFSFQTGSGSIDFGLLTFLKYSLDKQKRYNMVVQLTARFNTFGDRFKAHRNYLFGNTYQGILLLDRSFNSGLGIFNISLGGNFQYREKDVFDGGFKNQNTGGAWINAVAVAAIAFDPKFNLSVNGFVPVYRDLGGLQLTSSWMTTIGLGYVFN